MEESSDADYDLDGVSKGGIEKTSKSLAELGGHLFCGVAQKLGKKRMSRLRHGAKRDGLWLEA